MTHAVLKTIAAFLNTEGGDLLIGVADDGTIVGIERDQLESDDKFMRHLAQVVRNGLGDRAGTCIDPKTQILPRSAPMKQSDLLSVTSILSVPLLALHISQDIVFGFDRAGLNHLVGIAILLVLTCGAVLLRERRSGKVIMLLGGVMAAAMLPLHMRNGLRPEFLEKSGSLLFIWTLYVLGVTGAFSVILAIRALWGQRVAS